MCLKLLSVWTCSASIDGVRSCLYLCLMCLTVHHFNHLTGLPAISCSELYMCLIAKWPTWRTILYYVFIFIFNSLHVSSTSCSSSGETNCVNTTSGNCHSVSVAVSCAGRKFTSDLHTTRPPTVNRVTYTRCCIDTIDSPDDEHKVARNM